MTARAAPHRRVRVLAISSGGGHWVQLLRLRPAFDGAAVAFASVRRTQSLVVPGCRFFTFPDATRWNKLALAHMAVRVAWIIARVRPHVIVSTGAAPGYFAIRIGRLIGARTIWIDSVANVRELSMTGKLVGRHADLWLTQWPELAGTDGPHYRGSVL